MEVDQVDQNQKNIDAQLAKLLTQRFRTRTELLVAVKWSSSMQGFYAVTHKKSGGKQLIVTCWSSTENMKKDGMCKCSMQVIGRKSDLEWYTERPWALAKGTKLSDLKHSPGCQSECKVSQRELLANKAFVDMVMSNKFAKTKNLSAIVLAVGTPFHNMSIPATTIYRAKRRLLLSDPEYSRHTKHYRRKNRSNLETIPVNLLQHVSLFFAPRTLSRLCSVSRVFRNTELKHAEVVFGCVAYIVEWIQVFGNH